LKGSGCFSILGVEVIMKKFDGIHHVSCIATDPQANHDFYTEVLGLRLLKKTVNQDDVSAYHLFFGDALATPGSDITFFSYPTIQPKVPGSNCIDRVGLRVPTDASVWFWFERLTKLDLIVSQAQRRFGVLGIDVEDLDGTPLRIMSDENMASKHSYPFIHPNIPQEHAISGLGQIDIRVNDIEASEQWLVHNLGFYRVEGNERNRLYASKQDRNDTRISLIFDSSPSEQSGAGSIHHVALRVADNDHLQETMDMLNITGYVNSGIINRHYFKSLYVREKNRILFEFATDGPGFDIDEPMEKLGETLSLPPFLEAFRNEIESQINPIKTK
jgi:glyoxalase family protein